MSVKHIFHFREENYSINTSDTSTYNTELPLLLMLHMDFCETVIRKGVARYGIEDLFLVEV